MVCSRPQSYASHAPRQATRSPQQKYSPLHTPIHSHHPRSFADAGVANRPDRESQAWGEKSRVSVHATCLFETSTHFASPAESTGPTMHHNRRTTAPSSTKATSQSIAFAARKRGRVKDATNSMLCNSDRKQPNVHFCNFVDLMRSRNARVRRSALRGPTIDEQLPLTNRSSSDPTPASPGTPRCGKHPERGEEAHRARTR